MIEALQRLIERLEADSSLQEPDNLRQRIEVLGRLDAFDLAMPYVAADSAEAATYQHARALQAKLEAANLEIYEAIRRDIRQGYGSNALLRWMRSSVADGKVPGTSTGVGYDYLDELIVGVLQFGVTGAAVVPPAPEMVSYQPTPARHIFDLIDRIALKEHDLLVDLGSGLGHVPLLVAVCTAARSIGVELEPAYIDCARRSAEALNLKNVSFIERDARAAELTEGTVFYMYTPFTGSMLRAVLNSLRREGERRYIRICTFGPCTATVADEEWLEVVGAPRTDRVSMFCPRNRR